MSEHLERVNSINEDINFLYAYMNLLADAANNEKTTDKMVSGLLLPVLMDAIGRLDDITADVDSLWVAFRKRLVKEGVFKDEEGGD